MCRKEVDLSRVTRLHALSLINACMHHEKLNSLSFSHSAQRVEQLTAIVVEKGVERRGKKSESKVI